MLRRRAAYLLVALIPLLLYAQSIHFDFAYDDFWQIERNSAISVPSLAPASILTLFRTPTPPGDLYRPLTLLSYRLTYFLFGMNPAPYHLFNVCLFAFFCVLLLRFFNVFMPPGLALVVSLVYAVHPIHVEAVANIVGRAETLAAFFGLLAFLLFNRGLASTNLNKAYSWMTAGALTLFLATLCKESAFTFTFLIPAALLFLHKNQSRAALGKAKLWGLSIFLLLAPVLNIALRFFVFAKLIVVAPYTSIIPENPLFHMPFMERLAPALKILGDYISLLLFPRHLSADYSLMPTELLKQVYAAQGLFSLLLFALFCLCLWLFRKSGWSFWGLWFLLAFVLTANILVPIGTLMGERLAFTPAIGFIACLVSGADQLCARLRMGRQLRFGIVLLVISILFGRSYLRLPVWQNNQALFAATALDAPASPKSMFNYGIELAKQKKLEEAEHFLRGALELNPDHLPSARALTDILLERKALGSVEYWYRYILSRDPGDRNVADALERLLKLKKSARE